jgi:hypothetical protein
MSDETSVIYHVISYADWANLGWTDCCHRLVAELPKDDVCVPPGDREPGAMRCDGGRDR